jgi:predicted PurR-regulated permease PerM
MQLQEYRTPSPDVRPEVAATSAPPDYFWTICAWSLATLAILASGFALYAAREVLLPIVAAFVVGVMLSPLASRLEALRVPRLLGAFIIVFAVGLLITLVIDLILPRVSELTNGLPDIAATLGKKLSALDSAPWLHRFNTGGDSAPALGSLLPKPDLSWAPSTIGVLFPPLAGIFLFLVILMLFIANWPTLRRGLVMTFVSRDSRLIVLKILNDVETGLANYLLTVTLINVGLGVVTGGICALTGMPHAAGFGALAATLNFVPFLGPIAIFGVLLLVGVVSIPDSIQGFAAAAAFGLVAMIEGQFITPTIIGRSLELNGLAVLLSLAFWAWLWGPIGAFLSSPILIVALILVQRLYVEEGR